LELEKRRQLDRHSRWHLRRMTAWVKTRDHGEQATGEEILIRARVVEVAVNDSENSWLGFLLVQKRRVEVVKYSETARGP
jgi:hypothetical protein